MNDVDGGLFIATSDDMTFYRGKKRHEPRNNIIFEFGLFMGYLGRERVSMILVKDNNGKYPEIPTDLLGLTLLKYDADKKAQFESSLNNWIISINSLNTPNRSELKLFLKNLESLLKKVPIPIFKEIKSSLFDRFEQKITKAISGHLYLSSSDYYSKLLKEMQNIDTSSEVLAVASMSPYRWIDDRMQYGYHEANINAAKQGAKIRRIFIIEENEEKTPKVLSIIREQIKAGINLKIIRPGAIPEISEIDDIVIFRNINGKTKIYVDYQDPAFPLRVAWGELIFDKNDVKRREKIFNELWDIAYPISKTF
jgi:hypothetical protein